MSKRKFLPSKFSMEKIRLEENSVSSKKQAKQRRTIQTFANIQMLFDRNRKTLLLTDEEKKPVSLNPHLLK